MRPTVSEWGGTNIPEELRHLPAGRYLIQPVDYIEVLDDLTPEEDAGLRRALDQIEAGQGVPLDKNLHQGC